MTGSYERGADFNLQITLLRETETKFFTENVISMNLI